VCRAFASRYFKALRPRPVLRLSTLVLGLSIRSIRFAGFRIWCGATRIGRDQHRNPQSEAQTRALSGLPPDQQREAWQHAVETSKTGHGDKPPEADCRAALSPCESKLDPSPRRRISTSNTRLLCCYATSGRAARRSLATYTQYFAKDTGLQPGLTVSAFPSPLTLRSGEGIVFEA
jgi:hypothetical protein